MSAEAPTSPPSPPSSPPTRWWAWPSALLAPVAMIGGWTLAASLQPAAFDPVRETISALAGRGAADRWVMTAGLAALGVCHLVTAAGLGPARPAGRALLALGGLGTLAVAAFPLPVAGSSGVHTASATVAFVALTLWPALGLRRDAGWSLRPAVAVAATVVLAGLLVTFRLSSGSDVFGLTERLLAGAQSLWPLVAVLGSVSSRRSPAGATPRT